MAALLLLATGGVASEGWWSLQPFAKVDLPSDGLAKHPIDAFVQQRLGKDGLTPSPPALRSSRRVLVVFVVTGVPLP